MTRPLLIFIMIISWTCSLGQNDQNPLKALDNLIGGKWITKGKWKNGTEFHQEVVYQNMLSGNLITSITKDFIDSKQFEDSVRNFGVISWSKEKSQLTFYNFDVFGNKVEGTITVSKQDIFFNYDYEVNGKLETLTDAWLFVNPNEYEFRVGIYQNGKWEKVFISNTFSRTVSQ